MSNLIAEVHSNLIEGVLNWLLVVAVTVQSLELETKII